MANRRCVIEEVDGNLKFVIRTSSIPDTPKDGALIKVWHAGICHSDAHMAQGKMPGIQFPIVFGHEISGTVAAIGDDAAQGNPGFDTGDRVVVYPWGGCNNCFLCDNDSTLCLEQTRADFDKNKLFIYGARKDGGFQNYMVVHDTSFIIKVPDGVPMDVASLVPCSAITALNSCRAVKGALDEVLNMGGKAMVGLFGAGGLALWAIQILESMYPENVTVVAVDVVDEKLADAKEQGADLTFKWGIKDELAEVRAAYLQTSGGALLDGAIDFTGLSSVQERILALANVGATLALVGLGNGNLPTIQLMPLIFKGITIKGINTGNRAMCREIFDLLLQGKVRPPPITPVKVEDIADSVQKMGGNKIRGRHIVNMDS